MTKQWEISTETNKHQAAGRKVLLEAGVSDENEMKSMNRDRKNTNRDGENMHGGKLNDREREFDELRRHMEEGR